MAALIRILLFFPRLIGRLFGQGSTAVRKASGNLVADAANADGPLPVELTPARAYTFLFREIGRPKLPVVAASNFDLEQARKMVGHADTYFSRPFSLFPPGSLFYEEVERAELEAALGADSEDAGFVQWTTEFRKVLNDNARRLLLWYTPLIALLSAASAVLVHDLLPGAEVAIPVIGPRSAQVLSWPLAALAGVIVLMLIYQWPYKFAQQRNLLGFDNTITSRFSQLNQNFQVAKRQALNVERNKRMSQVEELKEEAAAWTLAYHWLAQRLLLSERLVRNQMYQANRNATLYSAGGFVLTTAILAVGGSISAHLFPARAGEELALALGSGLFFVVTSYLLAMGGVAGETRRVLEDNEWFRFSRIELDRAVAEHVGEDKLQIITFRDRNRLE